MKSENISTVKSANSSNKLSYHEIYLLALIDIVKGVTLNEIEKILKDQKSFVPQTNKAKQIANIQTPPLGSTPMPIVQTARADVNPNTNLTRTQEALLSPTEKVIAGRV